jgi:hypothetical protein
MDRHPPPPKLPVSAREEPPVSVRVELPLVTEAEEVQVGAGTK